MWIAIPVELYAAGWNCGDWVVVHYGSTYCFARAYDAGPLSDYCVMQLDGTCLPIVADVPEGWADWEGLSTPGRVINVSGIGREQ